MSETYKAAPRAILDLRVLPWQGGCPDFVCGDAGLCGYAGQMAECAMAEKTLCEIPKEHLYDASVLFSTKVLKEAEETGENAEALSLLIRAFRLYGKAPDGRYTLTGRSLADRITDFCLVKGCLPELAELYRTDLAGLGFSADFFCADFVYDFLSGKSVPRECTVLCAACLCDFDFRSFAHYRDHTEIYECAVESALSAALGVVLSTYGRSRFVPEPKKTVRCAYAGLPCPERLLRKVEITYLPFSEDAEIRSFVTSVVKYADNLVRQGLDVRSKLSGVGLSPAYRSAVNERIRSDLPGFLKAPGKVGRKPKHPRPPEPKEDAALPLPEEAIDLSVDFERARQIENDSWKLCALLGTEYGDEKSVDLSLLYGGEKGKKGEQNEADVPGSPAEGQDGRTSVSPPDGEGTAEIRREADAIDTTNSINETREADEWDEWTELFASLDETEKEVLACILAGESPERAAAAAGGFAEGFVSSINEKSSEFTGDILIESTDGGFSVIEDYREDVCRVCGQ